MSCFSSNAAHSPFQLVRPEFQAFLENEQKTIALVKDVADVLENISANSLHTPALYAGFLRALISAKTDPSSAQDRPSSQGGQGTPSQDAQHGSNSFGGDPMAYNSEPTFSVNEFQFDSEMGPVADMSTFPPTMAPNPSEDAFGALTVDNILSSGFWDSMLVPGMSSFFDPS